MPERIQSIQNEDHPRPIAHEQVAWDIPEEYRGIIAYNPRHDIQDFLNLKAVNGKIHPLEYATLHNQTVLRTKRQLEKALGERFAVERSSVNYFIKDGHLMSPDYPEPVAARYKKCQLFLAQERSTEIEREKAEVEGIRKAEQLLQKTDQKIVIISPKGPEGTLYLENFFDVWEKDEGTNITMTRYTSSLSLEEFSEAAKMIDPSFPEIPKGNLRDSHFLKTPLTTSLKTNQVLHSLSPAKGRLPESQYLHVIKTVTPFIEKYIEILESDPLNIPEVNLRLNAIYNFADITVANFQKPTQYANFPSVKIDTKIPIAALPLDAQIKIYGNLPVATVIRGCPGGQRGFSTSQPTNLENLALTLDVNSILGFSNLLNKQNEKVEDFQCPGKKKDGSKCTYTVRAYSGVKKCPECGLAATCT